MEALNEISAFRVLVLEMFAARDRALTLQAVETKRRLQTLNHENERLAAMRDSYVARDVYQKDRDRLATERDDSRKSAEAVRVKAEETATQQRRNTMIAWSGFGIALVGWGITLVLHFMPPR